MAIAPTGAIYKSLSFDGEDSRNYGVYITGEAVYNAPERDVEMITIPGRNGSFALDKGRFQNIEVSYPAGIFAETEADFREAISDFRNFLCSRNGYVRLQDEYNPDEYRMAVYKFGLEVDPAMLKAGEFKITFDCKPQRWLTSGESAVTIANSGDTITNPTLFESSPLLEIYGYGDISFNGFTISLENATLGQITITEGGQFYIVGRTKTFQINQGEFNIGDAIDVPELSFYYGISNYYGDPKITSLNKDSESLAGATTTVTLDSSYSNPYYKMTSIFPAISLSVGTSVKKQNDILLSGTLDNSTTFNNQRYSPYLDYDAVAGTITLGYTSFINKIGTMMANTTISSVSGVSTVSLIGNPTYADCDLGECYMIKDNTPVSLNQYIDLGSKLPILASGPNPITYDNTITELKVQPRWWKV